jgi:hypothetical protein
VLIVVNTQGHVQMVLYLSIVQHHLGLADLEKTKQALSQAEEGLRALTGEPSDPQHASLHLHYSLLWACCHLAEGDIETLMKSGVPLPPHAATPPPRIRLHTVERRRMRLRIYSDPPAAF